MNSKKAAQEKPVKTSPSIQTACEKEKTDDAGVSSSTGTPMTAENGCLICAGDETAIEIIIPDDITAIAPDAFKPCKNAAIISLPDSVTSLPGGLFSGLKKLRSVRLPENLTEIPEKLFSGCQALESFNLPPQIATIGANAFKGCKAVREIALPPSVKKIGNSAFANCTSLETILFSQLEEIAANAFCGCDALTSVTLPDSIQKIGPGAFKTCRKLTFVHLPNAIDKVRSTTFSDCYDLREVEVPDSAVFEDDVFLHVLNSENWEWIERKNGKCRRKLVDVLDRDPFSTFNMLREGTESMTEFLPQRAVFATLNAIWEYTQFDEEEYRCQITLFEACLRLVRILSFSDTVSLLSATWMLSISLIYLHGRRESSVERSIQLALSTTIPMIGNNGKAREYQKSCAVKLISRFVAHLPPPILRAVTAQFDHVLGIDEDFTFENPYEVRYISIAPLTSYWEFARVIGELVTFAVDAHIPIPKVDTIYPPEERSMVDIATAEEWCIAWSKSLSHYQLSVLLIELSPEGSEQVPHAVAVVSQVQLEALLQLFREVHFQAYYVWTNGARIPFMMI